MGARKIIKKKIIRKEGPGWHSPQWLSRRLVGGFVLLSTAGSGLGFMGWHLAQPDTLPIKTVEVEGEFRYLAKADLYNTIGDLASGGFFNVDVRAVKKAVESMAWIDRASVRRVWPDTLRVEIIEQIPLAFWNKHQGNMHMLNARGEIFRTSAKDFIQYLPKALPSFSGPEGTEKMVAERFQQLSGLMVVAGLEVVGLTLSKRRAWQVTTDNGLQILLGRSTGNEQLKRFTSVYVKAVADKAENINFVDLRYTNGFSVHWKKV